MEDCLNLIWFILLIVCSTHSERHTNQKSIGAPGDKKQDHLGKHTCPKSLGDDLRTGGKPDRQIGATHCQEWLQADARHDAVQGLGPAPATRALSAAAPGRALAPHTVLLANLPFDPAPEGAIRKSSPLPRHGGPRSQRNAPYVRTSTTQAKRCLNTWRGTRCRPPPECKTRSRPPTSSRGRHGDPRGMHRTPSPPPPPGGRPRGGPEGRRGGVWNGPGSRRCSPSRGRLRWTGPPDPPVAPPGSGHPTIHGPSTPRKPGCSGGPRSDADTGQLTPGGRGGRCPLAPLLEPLQRPRPTRPVLPGHTPTMPGAGGLYR